LYSSVACAFISGALVAAIKAYHDHTKAEHDDEMPLLDDDKSLLDDGDPKNVVITLPGLWDFLHTDKTDATTFRSHNQDILPFLHALPHLVDGRDSSPESPFLPRGTRCCSTPLGIDSAT
jgi:hypothetical protein